MKKIFCITLNILMLATLAACGGGKSEEVEEEFKASLDTQTKCNLRVVGNYSNFEALEAEFDKFNEFYPNVTMEYVKLDDYDNTLPTVLRGSEKPNIFFSEPKMIDNEKYAEVVSHMEDLSDPALKINLNFVRSSLIKKDSNGKVLTVPIFSRTYGALINKDLFKKEGLNVPEKWTDLLNVCASFTTKGYQSPIMGYSKDKKPSSGLMNAIAYPMFVAELAKNPEALTLANNLDPKAGKYMRGALTAVDQLVKNGSINIEECDKIGDNYEKVLLRFFDGDVPMMVCNGDTVSGAKKRESKSEPFKANPFEYSFYPIPVTEQGGYFIDSPSLEFSINKDCENLDMTNEFMRFIIRTKELSDMATNKGLIASTKDTSFQPVYAPFSSVPADRRISPEVIGVKDQLATQMRIASYQVGKGELTIDEAVAKYGSLE